MHQSLDKLAKKSEELDKNVKKDQIRKQKVMTMDELKKALISYGVSSSFDGSCLYLDMNNENVRNMIEQYKEYQFPDLEKLSINTNKENSDVTNKFLKHNFPSNINRFWFY